MTTPPTPSLRDLFDTLLPLPAAQRTARLADPALPAALVAEVQALLAHAPEATAQGFLSTPATVQVLAPDRSGQRLGAWQLLRPLGAGGMGEVWLAERADGAFQGQAAVKLLKRGMDSDAVLARFALEQQALARLAHPHIARLLDAGRSADGLPYFVMEHVAGRPLDQAAAALPLRQRLGLFLQLADAVAHAHRHLLVHRDLKPGNALVDGQGQVKLLDFGIAKALQPGDGDGAATATAAALAAYTPRYASPEQVRGAPVSTATDIYSLGVMLYELLTGRPPYACSSDSAVQAARAVLEAEPPRPSRVAPGAAATALRGDLDKIVLKALEKSTDRRYASVDALAADLRAHLAGRPVTARAQTAPYLLGKFVRRHPGASAGALASVLALAGGVAATLWQAEQARTARDAAQARLEQTRGIVRELVARHADAITFLPGGVELKARLLRDTVQRLQALLPDPQALPELAGELAQAHARLADLLITKNDVQPADRSTAMEHAHAAMALFDATAHAHAQDAHFHVLWARTYRSLALQAQHEGRVSDGLLLLEQRRDRLEAARAQMPADVDVLAELGETHVALAQLYDSTVLNSQRQPEQALAALDRALATYARATELKADDPVYPYQLGVAQGARMMALFRLGRTAEAVTAGREALAWMARARAAAPQHVAFRMGEAGEPHNLTLVLLETGDTAGALEMARLSEARIRALEADDPTHPAWPRTRQLFGLHYALAHLAAGLPAQALGYADGVVAATPAGSRVGLRMRSGWAQLVRAQALQALSRPAEARAALAAAREDLLAYTAHDPSDAQAWFVLGQVHGAWAGLAPAAGRGAQRDEALSAAEAAFARAEAATRPGVGLRPAQRAALQAWRGQRPGMP